MKTIYKLKGLFLVMLAFMMSSNVLAQDVITSTFIDKYLTTEEGYEWQGGPVDGYDGTKGAQFYKGNKDVVLTGMNNSSVPTAQLELVRVGAIIPPVA